MEFLLLYLLAQVNLHFSLKFLISCSWDSVKAKTGKELNLFPRLSLDNI